MKWKKGAQQNRNLTANWLDGTIGFSIKYSRAKKQAYQTTSFLFESYPFANGMETYQQQRCPSGFNHIQIIPTKDFILGFCVFCM